MSKLLSPLDARLVALLGLFPSAAFAPSAIEMVEPKEMPEPYRRLLVHSHHMTVTLEEHHSSPVRLHVLERRCVENDYARRLILTVPSGTGEGEKCVMAGIMRFALEHTSPRVRDAIISESAPLGRILIENDVLRWIETRSYLRLRLVPDLRQLFGAESRHTETYGRVASIICDHAPAVELLEVVCPELA